MRKSRDITKYNADWQIVRSSIKGSKFSLEEKFEPIFPPLNLCSDNAAMIAMVGLEKFKKKQFDNLDFSTKPRWQLDEKASFLKGAGVKI